VIAESSKGRTLFSFGVVLRIRDRVEELKEAYFVNHGSLWVTERALSVAG
jgi:hypothetical protein